MNPRRPLRLAALVVALAAAPLACNRTPPPLAPPKPPEVVVAVALEQPVTDFEEFTGRVEASETIEVRGQLSGELTRSFLVEVDKPIPADSPDKYVREGGVVNKGDLLFEIDPKLLQAELERAEANLLSSQARRDRLKEDFDLFNKLPPNSVSPTEFNKVKGDLKEASALVKSSEAALNSARVNREYCNVRASIDGRVSRRLLDPGNTVKAQETALTYLTKLDPMYAYFDVDERTYLRLYRAYQAKGYTMEQLRDIKVRIGLADERDEFPREGFLNFVDTRVDQNTGSVWIRAVVPNPKLLLTPGLFIRVRMPVSDPHQAVLIPEKALGTDQGQKYVYIVNEKSEAVYRPVEVGGQHQQMREVLKDGVKPGERIIVSGLQRVRSGAKVEARVEGTKESKK